MKIDILIEDQLEALYSEMGYTQEMIDEQYQLISKKIEQLFEDFLTETYEHCQELKQKAESIEGEIVEEMARFELGNDYGIMPNAPLLRRIDVAQRRLDCLHDATADQKDEYEHCFAELSHCFDLLEINNRGIYSQKGLVYGTDRIEAMSDKITELHAQISKNEKIINKLVDQLTQLHNQLGLETFEPPETLGDPTIESLQNEVSELTEKLDNNTRNITTVVTEVRRLERLFHMNQTSNKISVYSDENLERLKKRLDDLNSQKELKMDDYIEVLKGELLRLWGELHMDTPTQTEFPFFYSKRTNRRTLVALESEAQRLEKLKIQISPIMDLIAQREDIMSAYEEQLAAANDPARLTSRRGAMASTLMKEERVRKRYAQELPKVHAALIPLLEEYCATYGEPLLWDGVDILAEVKAMHAKEARPKKAQRTTARASSIKRGLTQRAPFQLQGYMT